MVYEVLPGARWFCLKKTQGTATRSQTYGDITNKNGDFSWRMMGQLCWELHDHQMSSVQFFYELRVTLGYIIHYLGNYLSMMGNATHANQFKGTTTRVLNTDQLEWFIHMHTTTLYHPILVARREIMYCCAHPILIFYTSQYMK